MQDNVTLIRKADTLHTDIKALIELSKINGDIDQGVLHENIIIFIKNRDGCIFEHGLTVGSNRDGQAHKI